MKNGLNINRILDLLLLSDVIIYREKRDNRKPGWSSPFKLISRERYNCVVDILNEFITLRSTSVKLYYIDEVIFNIEPLIDEAEDTIVVEMSETYKSLITDRKSLNK
jgi:hypothetical protein